MFNNGALRGDGVVKTEFDKELENKKFVFIDDSFFSGTTMEKVRRYLNDNSAELVSTFVFYDGCKEKKDNVFSFYRYY